MDSKNKKQIWETFIRRPADLKERVETAMVLRDLKPGRKKYQLRHVVALVSRRPEDASSMEELRVRTVIGVLLPETFAIKILKELPIELPGRPYHDFYEALRNAGPKSD